MTQSSQRNSLLLRAVALASPSIDDWSEVGKLARLSSSELDFFLSPGSLGEVRHVIVARLEGRVVAALFWRQSTDGTARLLGLRVDPLFRGLGIARLLIGRMERDVSGTAATIVASTDLATADCLRRLGYELAGYDRGNPLEGRPTMFHVAKSFDIVAHTPAATAPPAHAELHAGSITHKRTRAASLAKRHGLPLPPRSGRPGGRRAPAKPLH